ncbi:MAG: hypothetical protein RLZZ230_99 [Candidatus Parcubacteria bacterium]|jgi:dihydroorotate dehydrogenase (fumarate)
MTSATKIAGITIPTYIGNASGVFDTTSEQLNELMAVTSFITLKSTTIKPRLSNPEPCQATLLYGSIQTAGLPNMGILETIRWINTHYHTGLVIKANISGNNSDECLALMSAFQASPVSLIEINVTCQSRFFRKPIACDLPALDKLLSEISNIGNKPIGVKLPYYGNVELQRQVVKLLLKHKVKFVTCSSSILGLDIDVETEASIFHYDSLQNSVDSACVRYYILHEVCNYHKLLRGTGVSIIGAGGVQSGKDVYNLMIAGADVVEVGSLLESEGLSCLHRLAVEFETVLKQKNTTIERAKGSMLIRSGH